jgi:hypothetical protein
MAVTATPTLILALMVGLYLIVARGIALLDPKFEKKIWMLFVKRPALKIERMGFMFIGLALVMVYFALPDAVTFEAVVLLVAAGWLLCMGALATQVKPVTDMSRHFARQSDLWVRLVSLIFVVVGLMIFYLVFSAGIAFR